MSTTILIILVTVAISIAALGNERLYLRFLMNPYRAIEGKEPWRFITSGFIHNGYIHLGFNMFTFFFFGQVVENIFEQVLFEKASLTYILFYLSAIVISDLPVAIKNRHNPGYNSLGASGAVSAIVFCSILFFPLNKICLYGLLCLPGFILGLIYVIYSYWQGKNAAWDNVNHEAHLYGALYGLVFGLIIYPQAGPSFLDQILNYRFI